MPKLRVRGALAALFMLAAVPAVSACAASSSYAGIPLTPGAADLMLQQLARSAREGDKAAQLSLGIRYEYGQGVPVDWERAERLYRAAATPTGGVRIAHIPGAGSNGRSAAVPVNAGNRSPGLAAAAVRLEALRHRRMPQAQGQAPDATFFREDGSPAGLTGPVAEAFATLLRVELHSDRCFHFPVAGDEMEYWDTAWRCIMRSELPQDCRQSSDAVIRVVRFIRHNPSFTLLHRTAVAAIERCVAQQNRSIDAAYASRQRASMLDMVLHNLDRLTETQKRLVDTTLQESHYPRVHHSSIGMCVRLIINGSIEPLSFWLMFCNSGNMDFTERYDRARVIDAAIAERGLRD